jgi:signal peptidase I
MRGAWRAIGKFLVFTIIVGGIAFGILKLWYVDIVEVGHNGMAPTMIIGDRVLVWRNARLERNDIALCRHPTEEGRYVIGRVLLETGESLAIDRGMMRRNSFRIGRDIRGEVDFVDGETGRSARYTWGVEEIADTQTHLFFEHADRAPVIRDQSQVRGLFLLGDNRAHVGEDSRAFGVVQPVSCVGQVFLRAGAGEGLPDEIPHRPLDIL